MRRDLSSIACVWLATACGAADSSTETVPVGQENIERVPARPMAPPSSPNISFSPAILQWLLPDFYEPVPCQVLLRAGVAFRRKLDPEQRILRQEAIGDPSGPTITEFEYDEQGRIREVRLEVSGQPGVVRSFHWSGDQLVGYVVMRENHEAAPFVMDYTCSAQGRSLQCKNEELSLSLSFEVDEGARLVTVEESLTPGTSSTTRYSYASDRPASVERATADGKHGFELAYDDENRIVELLDPTSRAAIESLGWDCDELTD